MERPSYLNRYKFDWELLDVVVGGRSALDTPHFIGPMYDYDQVNSFLRGYGLDPNNPVSRAELFGNFQESLQFIKRYFLKEGNEDGLDLKVPNSFFMITEINDLFLKATNDGNKEERYWAEAIIKVMHTILHVDKDLRSSYFSIIQTQIFDRYYKFLFRNSENKLFLGEDAQTGIPLVDFETKSKKARESVIIKLLHKAENVAEELFDRVGIRFVTETKFDALRIIEFLIEKNVVIPHNIKPSRSHNTLVDLNKFKESHQKVIKMAIRNKLTEERFLAAIEREAGQCQLGSESDPERNRHTLQSYQSIQFTCRHLIKYKSPFLKKFNELKKIAKQQEQESKLSKMVLNLDVSQVAKDVRFFYPYEIQIVDIEGHRINTEGQASHLEYKRSQVRSAMKRVFRNLIEHKGIKLEKELP